MGQYLIVEKIAQGGMAEIFRGKALEAHGLERPVVIKRILPHIAASPEFVEMLIDEAKIAVMLSHGNIAQIYDLGKVADDYFIVMEYVEGKTLSQLMRRLRAQGSQMPIAGAVAISAQIARGLDYMHRKADEAGLPLKIIHRDISPQNIILSPAGTVKIIDFGIAKAKTKVSTTDSGVVKGKFAYMSPEHAEGERLDHRTDLFSLGIILFELLTGQRLFKGKNNTETLKKVKKAKVPPPSDLRNEIPRELDRIVLHLLQKEREKRQESAQALEQQLTRFLVRHDPEFTDADLAHLLLEIFPEIRPERLPGRTAGEAVTEVPERYEETVAADTGILREKLKALDAFELPTREEEPSLSPVPSDEGTSLMRRPLVRQVGIALGVLAASAAALLFLWTRPSDEGPPQGPPDIQQPVTADTSPPTNEEARPPTPEPPSAASSGFLTIDSTPQGALLFLNDQPTQERTPTTLKDVPAGIEHRVGLYLEQHKFWEGSVRVEGGRGVSLNVAMQPNLGDLAIESLPPGALVYLNGEYSGQTPVTLNGLPPETIYRILLKKDGYEDWEREVKIFGGKREVVSTSLKKKYNGP